MVACHVVPFDAVRVEVVEDGQASLLMRRILSCSSIVGLGKISSAGVGPVSAGREGHRVGPSVRPEHSALAVVDDTTCPKVSLCVLGDQLIEPVLLLRCVKGDRLHAHGVAVLLGVLLGELAASILPRDYVTSTNVVPGIRPKVIRCRCSTQSCTTCNCVGYDWLPCLNWLTSHWLGHK